MLIPQQDTPSYICPCDLFPFEEFLRSKGLTRTTGYRYRRDGLIFTVNIHGRLYITVDEIKRFERRAISGEFVKKSKTPVRGANREQDQP